MNQNRNVVIDVQGFCINNNLFAKEVCVVGVDSEIKTFLILPPFKYSELTYKDRITNKWLYNHLHGLCWNDGNSTLNEFREYIISYLKKEHYHIIYVKGIEKVKWLSQLLGEMEIYIYNLDDFNCPNIRTLYKSNININICKYHRNSCKEMCAKKSAILYRNFINLYVNKENIENI